MNQFIELSMLDHPGKRLLIPVDQIKLVLEATQGCRIFIKGTSDAITSNHFDVSNSYENIIKAFNFQSNHTMSLND